MIAIVFGLCAYVVVVTFIYGSVWCCSLVPGYVGPIALGAVLVGGDVTQCERVVGLA